MRKLKPVLVILVFFYSYNCVALPIGPIIKALTKKSADIAEGVIKRTDDVVTTKPTVREVATTPAEQISRQIRHALADENLIIDLKTTADIKKFRWSAKKYNYDSQAYIYRKIFGYDLIFMVIDKTTHQIGLYDCSDKFYETGAEKVKQASEVYDLFYKTEGFEPKEFFYLNR